MSNPTTLSAGVALALAVLATAAGAVPAPPEAALQKVTPAASLARPNPTGDGTFDAVRRNDLAALKAALAVSGADVRDGKGRTPLMLAAEACHPDAARLLLDAGARADLKDAAGDTAFELARRNAASCGELAKLLGPGGGPH
jgi:hypothetical protein